MNSIELIARHIDILGLVQGVGFRPFIYRHAMNFGLCGWVRNFNGGVEVFIQGPESRYNDFVSSIVSSSPATAHIAALKVRNAKVENISGFEIKPSLNGFENITNISPDTAVCPDCLQDLKIGPRRLNYPFTNCAHCGPRFSIIKKIPYDRNNTTMSAFEMCQECDDEYRDAADRRFHAQTISCEQCGPGYKWVSGNNEETKFDVILYNISAALDRGEIIAIKGTGGFSLVCDARNDFSIARLREIKQRYSKPFAVMFRNTDTVRRYARMNESEKAILLGWRRPVVILDAIKNFSFEVNKGFTTIGAILPYTPFHHLLMDYINADAIVFTSANLKGEPLISDNQRAFDFFRNGYCDSLLYHNRDIRNKQDDSVVREVAGTEIIIRRARGYVPEPVMLKMNVEGILAMGADLKNCFSIGKDNRAIMSQYIGDLEDYDVFTHYQKTIEDFAGLFSFSPRCIVFDAHPEYHSSRYGLRLTRKIGNSNPPAAIRIQHHHAHIASVMAEYQIDEKVIGVAMDGTGFGDDGKIWGSEFLVCDLDEYRRICHLAYIPLPGGEKAIKEPWRTAAAVAYQTFGNEFLQLPIEFNQMIGREKLRTVIKALKNNINIYESCGMGRLFDVAAALLNIVHTGNFDGEGPIKLENIYQPDRVSYPLVFVNNEYRFEPVVRGIIEDLLNEVPERIISGRFHNTITSIIIDGVEKISAETGLKKVVLSGGIFQNRIITGKVSFKLTASGYEVYTNRQVPCNDGGIALGQTAIASKKMLLCV